MISFGDAAAKVLGGLTVETSKVASIVGHACMCSDDGRALTYEWQLYLNDHGGKGNWHGGPAFPNTCSRYDTEEAARKEAEALGYRVLGTQWS
jgi:hypothetical protein